MVFSRYVAIVVAAAFVFLPVLGMHPVAADELSGTIQSVDTVKGSFTLEDGTEFFLSDDMTSDDLSVGTEILVIFERSADGTLLAIALALLS